MAIHLWPLVIAALGGGLIGLSLMVFGGGGSILATPLLVYGSGVRDAHVAIGTSAAGVAVNAAVCLVGHGAAGRVKWQCAMVFGAAGLVGSLLGAHFAKQTDGMRLLLWFAFAMAAVGVSMFLPRRMDGDPDIQLGPRTVLKLAVMGLVVGLVSGFFGIGGGFLIVPGLIACTGMPLANAAASSLFSVALFGAATSLSYAVSGLVDGPLFLALAGGGVAGSLAGMPLARVMSRHASEARRVFAAMIFVTAAYVAWRSLH